MRGHLMGLRYAPTGLLLVLWGCADPIETTTQPSTRPSSVTTAPAKLTAIASARPNDAAWGPRAGRMGSALRERHGLMALPRQTGSGTTILFETFSESKGGDVPGWRTIGQPVVMLRASRSRGKWLQLRGGDVGGPHGLAYDLPEKAVRGKALRVRVNVRLPVGQTIGSPDVPVVRLEWRNPDGRTAAAKVPIPPYVSPGWETVGTVASIPRRAEGVRLTMTQPSQTTEVGLDDVLVEVVDPLAEAQSAGTDRVRTNLIDGGDFEVGQRDFSVSGARQIPGREGLRACPLAWRIDETVAQTGRRSLRIPLDTDEFRLAFGWVRVEPGQDYVLSMSVRSNTKITLRVGMVEYPGAFRFDYFTVDPGQEFRPIALKVPMSASLPWSATAVVVRPSKDPKHPYTRGPSNFVWIDSVSLTEGAAAQTYEPPCPVEVGVLGPNPDPVDVAHLVPIGDQVSLTMRFHNHQDVAYRGQVAVDLLDAFDQSVSLPSEQQTLRVNVPPGRSSEEEIGPLTLPRGYYKLMVTAWPGVIGRGRPYSRAEHGFCVVNLTDPVPTGNYFGMTVEDPRMSQRITQFGAGWIWLRASRQWCQTAGGELNWSWYSELMSRALAQKLEVIADLDWTGPDRGAPVPGQAWQEVCRAFATVNKGRAAAIGVLDEGGLDRLAPEDYGTLLEQASEAFRRVAPKVVSLAAAPPGPQAEQLGWLKRAIKDDATKRAVGGLALRFEPTPMPEDIEPALEELRSWRKTYPFFKQYVDVGVGDRGPSAYLHVPNLFGYREHDAAARPDVPDPVLHASRLVRGLAIRQFAIIDRAAWWVESYRPPDILRPTVTPQCHEYDNAPRPVLAAFDFMAELLNPAVLTEWIDLPQQTRALCFERPKGELIVMIWRPFGRTLGTVGLRGLAGRVRVFDLFGRRELHPSSSSDLLVMVNEMVRYIRVPSETKAAALAALRSPMSLTTSGEK